LTSIQNCVSPFLFFPPDELIVPGTKSILPPSVALSKQVARSSVLQLSGREVGNDEGAEEGAEGDNVGAEVAKSNLHVNENAGSVIVPPS